MRHMLNYLFDYLLDTEVHEILAITTSFIGQCS
jgi:hypothetical protein